MVYFPRVEGERRVEHERVRSLDGLRGLCALVVVVYHLALTYPGAWAVVISGEGRPFWKVVFQSPLVLAVSGTAAVSVFFVLSGYVLALSFLKSDRGEALPYLLKRIPRIWIPYAFAVGVSALLMACVGSRPLSGASAWLSSFSWQEPLNARMLLQYGLMTGATSLDNVVWSLVHEMRISLIFPALVLLAARSRRIAVSAALVISLAAIFIEHRVQSLPLVTTLAETLSYLYLFGAGAALYLERERVRSFLSGTGRKASGWILALLMIYAADRIDLLEGKTSALLLAGAGSALIVALVSAAGPALSRLLEARPMLWLGSISYSLYLVHVPALLLTAHLWSGVLPHFVVLGIALVLALAAASAMNLTVEKGALRLGRGLARRLLPGAAPPAPAIKPALAT